jgi:hypothetical protein
MTCDLCFDGKHWKCHDPACGCNVCASGRAKATPLKREAVKKERVKREPRVRDRTGERARYYQSPVSPEQQKVRTWIGALTRFNTEQVTRIFEAKKAGVSISELAREFDTTRDKIRTVYNSPAAPPAGERPKRRPPMGAQRFTTIREEFDGNTWQVVYKKQWSNSSR